MAVAHSSASESHAATTGSVSQTSFTWTHTQTGTPQGVLVFVHVANSGGNPVSSVTYGSVPLTRVSGGAAVDAAGELGRTDLFFAGSGLASGNQTITVNRANTTDIMYASAATVTAATNTNVTGIILLEGDGTLTQQSVTDGGAPTNSLRYAAAYSGLAAPPVTGANSTSLTSIDFGQYGAAMVRETTAGTGARLVGFTDASDDRAAVHVAVRELWNRTDTEVVGAFTLTGPANTLTRGRSMTGDVGSFTLTGQPAATRHNPDIDGGVGAFTLAGQPAATRHNPRLDGGVGSFALTGQPATLSKTAAPKSLAAEIGAFALNGGAPGLLVGSSIAGGVGSFTLNGNSATLTKGRTTTAETGKFFLPERNLHQRSEEFNNGYWSKANSSVTANSTTAPDGTLTADTLIENTTNTTHIISKNLAFTTGVKYTASLYVKTYQGRDVALVLGTTTVFGGTGNTVIVFSPSTNTILLTGNSPEAFGAIDVGSGWYRIYVTKTAIASATVSGQIQLRIGTTGVYAGDGTSGAYIWGAQWEEGDLTEYDPTGAAAATPATLLQQYRLDGGVGSFTLTGQPASLNKGRTITGEVGSFTLTGQPATFRHTWAVQAARGAFTLTGNPAILAKLNAYSIDAARGSFTFTGRPATFSYNQSIAAAAGAFALLGNSITLTKSGTTRRRNVLIF